MSYENLKKIEKELENYAVDEIRNDPNAAMLKGQKRYAYLFQKVVKKAAREIDRAHNVNNHLIKN